LDLSGSSFFWIRVVQEIVGNIFDVVENNVVIEVIGFCDGDSAIFHVSNKAQTAFRVHHIGVHLFGDIGFEWFEEGWTRNDGLNRCSDAGAGVFDEGDFFFVGSDEVGRKINVRQENFIFEKKFVSFLVWFGPRAGYIVRTFVRVAHGAQGYVFEGFLNCWVIFKAEDAQVLSKNNSHVLGFPKPEFFAGFIFEAKDYGSLEARLGDLALHRNVILWFNGV